MIRAIENARLQGLVQKSFHALRWIRASNSRAAQQNKFVPVPIHQGQALQRFSFRARETHADLPAQDAEAIVVERASADGSSGLARLGPHRFAAQDTLAKLAAEEVR